MARPFRGICLEHFGGEITDENMRKTDWKEKFSGLFRKQEEAGQRSWPLRKQAAWKGLILPRIHPM